MKASALIRKLAGENARIWNDRLVDGRRSFKVYRWNELDARVAVTELKLSGFDAELKTHSFKRGRYGVSYFTYRIWVNEAV